MKNFYASLLAVAVIVSLSGCLFPKEKDVPTVITSAVTDITETTATCGGNVTDDGNEDVAERGVCWSTWSTPYSFDPHTTDGYGKGSFTSSISGLTANTTYYVRAYAVNSMGTSYGEAMTFTTSTPSNPGTVTDIDGNTYNTIQIGNQIWMKENLKVTHYRNGDAIDYVSDANAWSSLTTGGYCYYDNLFSNFSTYGGLYNWAAVNDSRNIAPVGWHIPSYNEWITLMNNTGGYDYSGGKLKEIGNVHWTAPNNASDEYGFTALPSGLRDQLGNYFAMGTQAYWWSSTEGDPVYSWGAAISYNETILYTVVYEKPLGFPVRCVKD